MNFLVPLSLTVWLGVGLGVKAATKRIKALARTEKLRTY
jgi:hypothetical protein